MSRSPIILQLGETGGGKILQLAIGAELREAGTALEALSILAEGRPDAIAMGCDTAWARTVVETLEPRMRPAVIVIGPRTLSTVGLADQWLPLDAPVAMARQRLGRAFARVSARQLHPGGGFLDTLTGLPNGRALLRALLRKLEWARLRRNTVSLVFLNVKAGEPHPGGPGEREWLLEVGSALQRHVRRTEVGGRLARLSFAVIVLGDRRAACGAALRMEALLASRGVAVTSAVVEVKLARPALTLLRERMRRHEGLAMPARSGRVDPRSAPPGIPDPSWLGRPHAASFDEAEGRLDLAAGEEPLDELDGSSLLPVDRRRPALHRSPTR